ncbi:hypothetical protein PMAYCL1PPCAC_31931, partial [Pristionchus mayeri]
MWSSLLIVNIIYVPIFMLLWIVEITLIIVHIKDFTSSYYFFFVLCGIISLINETNINFGTRLPLFPEVNSFYGSAPWIQQGLFPMLLYAISHFFGAFHECINICTAVNRATSIIAPNSHVKIWRYGIPFACLLMVLFGAASSWHLFDSPCFFAPAKFEGRDYYLMMSDTSKHPDVSNSRNGVIVALVSPAISMTLYLTAICFLRKKWKLKIVRTEFSLLLLGCCSMMFSLPLAFQQLYFFVKGESVTEEEALMLFQMLPWLFDLRFFSPTILILITDSNMRDKFLRFLSLRQDVSSILVALPSTVTSSS